MPPDDGGPPGQTGPANLGAMTPFHHRVKTHGHWRVKQPFPGVFVWRDPHGRLYLVDHTGTRAVGKTHTGADPPNLTLEVYPHDPDVELHYERRHAG